jgi:hypothetical protein
LNKVFTDELTGQEKKLIKLIYHYVLSLKTFSRGDKDLDEIDDTRKKE